MLDDRVHVAALALGAAAGVQPGVAEPGVDVDLGAELVAEQRQRRVPEREGGVEGDRHRDGVDRAGPHPQHPVDAPVVRRRGVLAGGQREPVAVHDPHVSKVTQ